MFAICWILEFQIISSSSAGLHLSEFCVAHADSADLKGQVLRLIFQPLLALMKLGPSLPQLPTQRSPGEVRVVNLTLNPRWGPGPNVFPFWVCRRQVSSLWPEQMLSLTPWSLRASWFGGGGVTPSTLPPTCLGAQRSHVDSGGPAPGTSL